jgi:hypothetical protein
MSLTPGLSPRRFSLIEPPVNGRPYQVPTVPPPKQRGLEFLPAFVAMQKQILQEERTEVYLYSIMCFCGFGWEKPGGATTNN